MHFQPMLAAADFRLVPPSGSKLWFTTIGWMAMKFGTNQIWAGLVGLDTEVSVEVPFAFFLLVSSVSKRSQIVCKIMKKMSYWDGIG